MFRRILKYTLEKTMRPLLLQYLSADRRYSYKGVTVLVKKGVFHPGFFFSTRFLLYELAGEKPGGKTLLELGAGSGLISAWAAKQGAIVTATDINPAAVDGLHTNLHHLHASVFLSDLFDNIPTSVYDYIMINPPYYPRKAKNDSEKAWFCGENYEYFEKLFAGIGDHMHQGTKAWMVLSEDCNLERIRSIASQKGWELVLKTKKSVFFEQQFIFYIRKAGGNDHKNEHIKG